MRRESCIPRGDWRARVNADGLLFHTIGDETYWDESACWVFTADEVDVLDDATVELHARCLDAVDHVVRTAAWARHGIDPSWGPAIATSWERERDGGLYGRFDLAFDGSGAAKLLEYNADTPTGLLEASVIQWRWLEDCAPGEDQFNSIHEQLVARLAQLARSRRHAQAPLHVVTCAENLEDAMTASYIQDCALAAGWPAHFLDIGDLGWDGRRFVDRDDAPVTDVFKLYPWEWMLAEPFAAHLVTAEAPRWIEPLWKRVLSTKAILPVLWELFPGHPNLLEASFDQLPGNHVRKPLHGREGDGVVVVRDGAEVADGGRRRPTERCVYQAYHPLAHGAGGHAVIGSWVVGHAAAGIGIREDRGLVTTNRSRFVPHRFIPRSTP